MAARLCTAFGWILDRTERCVLVVTHEILIDDLLHAIDGRPPAQVHSDIPFATPYRLPAADVARGIAFLRALPG